MVSGNVIQHQTRERHVQEAPATMCVVRESVNSSKPHYYVQQLRRTCNRAGTQKWLRCVLLPPWVWWEERAGLEPRRWSGWKPQNENRGGWGQDMSSTDQRWAWPQGATKCYDDWWRSFRGHRVLGCRSVYVCQVTKVSLKDRGMVTMAEKLTIIQNWKK